MQEKSYQISGIRIQMGKIVPVIARQIIYIPLGNIDLKRLSENLLA